MDSIDKNNNGSIKYDKFLGAVRGPVNKRRRALIDLAFRSVDRTGDGIVSAEDLVGKFNVNHHPDVASGKLPPHQALGNFFAQFGGHSGKITKPEFQEYY